jgi:DNA-binding transcriptional LysR family regulator
MELHQVRYFLSVSRSLNFTRAAEQCNVTQPALTKAVQKLEYELGGELIHRERQLTQLTDLGKLVLPMLQNMITAADAVRLHAREFQRKEIAPLKIGLTPCISAKLIVRPLFEIARLMPGLQVEMIEEPLDRLLDMLLEGQVNIALVGETGVLPDRIDHWRLFEERFVVLLSASDPLAKQRHISIETMADTVWLERVGCEVVKQFWDVICPRQQGPKIGHRGQQESHLQHLVAAGLGAMLAAEHTPRLPSLVAIPIEGDPLWREVRLLAVAGRRYSPALDAFIKIARVFDWRNEVESAAHREPARHQQKRGCGLAGSRFSPPASADCGGAPS